MTFKFYLLVRPEDQSLCESLSLRNNDCLRDLCLGRNRIVLLKHSLGKLVDILADIKLGLQHVRRQLGELDHLSRAALAIEAHRLRVGERTDVRQRGPVLLKQALALCRNRRIRHDVLAVQHVIVDVLI